MYLLDKARLPTRSKALASATVVSHLPQDLSYVSSIDKVLVDSSVGGGSVVPTDHIRIYVRFPREGCTYTFEEASASVFDRFPDAAGREKGLTAIRASLADQARVTIYGFGMPFANADDPEVQGWLNENKPITGSLTLLDVFAQRTFYIVVRQPVSSVINKFSIDRLPPFAYPYGTDQEWDVSRFKELIKANRGEQFNAVYE